MRTPSQLRALSDLADFLVGVPQEKFNMAEYRMDAEGDTIYWRNENDCGTSGCALGWAPHVPGLEPVESDFDADTRWGDCLRFKRYCKRVFGLVEDGHSCNHWEWCFSGRWAAYDNTPIGAARRIRFYVLRDLPENFVLPSTVWMDIVNDWAEEREKNKIVGVTC